MNTNNNGKPGTITPDEFNTLTSGVASYGAKVVASKVAKICSKKSASLKHEYPSSTIASAYDAIASKITGAVGLSKVSVSSDFFNSLTGMVALYGPEVVTSKLSKIAKRAGNNTDSVALGGLFIMPKKASAPAKAAPARRW